MASTDNVVINVRERPLSSDINNLQSMIGRDLLDILQQMMSETVFNVPGSGPGSATRNVVLNGLEVVANGSNVSVNAGALLQYSLTLPPALGSLDSPYRMGISRAAQTLAMPSPGVESWVVIEAQMTEVITVTASRDILDPGTGNFVPTLVDKQKERQLQFQVSAANPATIPAFSGGDWIPIAAVRRPGGGGAVAPGDIYDLRDLWSERLGRGNQNLSALNSGSGNPLNAQLWTSLGAASEAVTINYLQGVTKEGQLLWFSSNGVPVTINVAPFTESGFAPAAGDWCYLYLAPWRGLPVRNGQAGGAGNALLVVSQVAPSFDLYNAAPITPSAPFSSTTLGVGEAVCVGALLRNSLNNGWNPIWTADGRTWTSTSTGTLLANFAPPSAGANNVVLGTNVPACARILRVTATYNGADPSPTPVIRTLVPTPAGASTLRLAPLVAIDDAGDIIHQTGMPFEIPLQALNAFTFDFDLGGGAPDPSSTLTVAFAGWRM